MQVEVDQAGEALGNKHCWRTTIRSESWNSRTVLSHSVEWFLALLSRRLGLTYPIWKESLMSRELLLASASWVDSPNLAGRILGTH
jgi:hypothetical protein